MVFQGGVRITSEKLNFYKYPKSRQNKFASIILVFIFFSGVIVTTGDYSGSDITPGQPQGPGLDEGSDRGSARATPLVNIGPDQFGTGKFGEVVVYNLTVTNLQTFSDHIDITSTSDPSGLSVTLFEADGATLLKDSVPDGDGIPDTGLIAGSASVNITVKITIPSDKFINEPEVTLVHAAPTDNPSGAGDMAKLVTDANPFLDITQSVDPKTIYVKSAEDYGLNTRTRVTLNVLGGGLPLNVGDPLDIVLTLDNSGSMNGQPINSLVVAANSFIDRLNDEDRVTIFCFEGGPWPNPAQLLDWTFMTSAGKVAAQDAISGLLSDSNHYTPIWDTVWDAINKASESMAHHRPIVIAMTDGENNRDNYGVVEPQGPCLHNRTWY